MHPTTGGIKYLAVEHLSVNPHTSKIRYVTYRWSEKSLNLFIHDADVCCKVSLKMRFVGVIRINLTQRGKMMSLLLFT